MTDYALALAKEAETLEPPMTERELIVCIARHFPENIVKDLRPAILTSLNDMIAILDTIENDAKYKTLIKIETKAEQTVYIYDKPPGNYNRQTFAYPRSEMARSYANKQIDRSFRGDQFRKNYVTAQRDVPSEKIEKHENKKERKPREYEQIETTRKSSRGVESNRVTGFRRRKRATENNEISYRTKADFAYERFVRDQTTAKRCENEKSRCA